MRGLLVILVLSGCAGRADVTEDNREPFSDLQPIREGDGIFHTIAPGETLAALAHAYGVSLADLAGLNDKEPGAPLRPGDKLFIPGATREVPTIAVASSDAHEVEILEKNRGTLSWPLDGIVTSRFGVRAGRRHDGIDIAAPTGTPIVVADSGDVIYSGSGQRGYGNMVIVRHSSGLVTIYAHNKENLAHEGDHLKRGQRIALVGQTGRADGPHVHFEVRQGERPKNPLLYLPR